MPKENPSQSGSAQLLLILAVIAVMGFMVFSNAQTMNQFSQSKDKVLGAATSNNAVKNNFNQLTGTAQSLLQKVVRFIQSQQ